jgi:type VI protein secretion system component VasK
MRKLPLLIACLCLVTAATPALAYIGPGAGITMLGALWGVIVAVALAIGAVLFYPIRVVMRRFKRPAAPDVRQEAAARDRAAQDAAR